MTAERATTLADIEKIAETDPKAADAALQRMKLARETRGTEAPADIDSFELGDLKVGGESDYEVIECLDELDASDTAGDRARAASAACLAAYAIANAKAKTTAKTEAEGTVAPADSQVIEYLGELDASAVDTVEAAIAVAEAYEDQPDEPIALSVAIQEYKARQPTRGGARPTACKDFGVDVTDPQALDKVRTAFKLKRFGKALADLEAYHPGFWALPLETDDRSPSRKLVLSRFLWNRETGIERQKKREAKIAAKGWPANYHDLSPHQQRTIRNRLLKRKSRERAKTLDAAGLTA